MLTYLGDNDPSTLDAVIRVIDRRMRQAQRESTMGKQWQRHQAAGEAKGLAALRDELLNALEAGPTPQHTREVVARLRAANDAPADAAPALGSASTCDTTHEEHSL